MVRKLPVRQSLGNYLRNNNNKNNNNKHANLVQRHHKPKGKPRALYKS